jgi:aminopeptidase N
MRMTGRRWLAGPLTAALVTTLAGSVAGPPTPASGTSSTKFTATPGARGLGDRLFPGLGNGGYQVDHYDLAMTYHPGSRLVSASTTVRARATQPLSRFDLDLDGPTVTEVSVDGRPAAFARPGAELVITPERPLAAGAAFTVQVRYTADPQARTTCRIPDVDASTGWFATPDGFFTAPQPHCAHTIFPANDHPSDPATYSFAITAPTGTTAVTNGVPAGRAQHQDGRHGTSTTWRYEQREPMATELLQIAVGRYTVTRGVGPHRLPLRSVITRGREADTAAAVADVGSQVAWLERQVGRYPFGTYGLLGTRSYSNALETQTLSVYNAKDLTGRPRDWAPLTMHELSHQWFGDSVLPGTWSDLWLNEGHATWYETTYSQHLGIDRLDDRMKQAYRQSNRWRRAFGPPARPARARTMFSPNVYDGGALVLYALRQKVGTRTFARIERAWTTTYRSRVARTSDYIDLASQVAGRDLHGYLDGWLYGASVPPMPGHPDWRALSAS